jgi:hypothetical protein
MFGRLLTRRTTALVAALTLGSAGVAQATTTATVTVDGDGNGTLTVTGDNNANLIAVYGLAREKNTTTGLPPSGAYQPCTAADEISPGCHDVIIVKDGDANTMPANCDSPQCQAAEAATVGGDETLQGVLLGSGGCIVEDSKTLRCSAPQSSGVGNDGNTGHFSKVLISSTGSTDIVSEYPGRSNGIIGQQVDTAGRNVKTIAVPVFMYGGDADDVLFGSRGVDRIYGGAGGDDLRGGDGNDIVYPGGGDDTVYGDDGTATGTDDGTDGGGGARRCSRSGAGERRRS